MFMEILLNHSLLIIPYFLLFYKFSVFKEKVISQLIRQLREKFLHKYGTLTGECKHQCSFLFPYGF